MHLTKNKEKQEAIKGILEKHKENLLRIKGILDLGVGYKIENKKLTDQLAIIVEVVNQEAARAQLPTSIEGIELSLIEAAVPETLFQPGEIIHPKIEAIAKKRNQGFEKLIGGIRIRNGWGPGLGSGTLGAIVYDRQTGKPHGLTSRHVLIADKSWRSLQKLRSKYPVIHPDSKWTSDTEIGTVSKTSDASMDCIRFPLHPKREINEDQSLLGIQGKISGIEPDVICGTKVMKSGSQTGLTYGVIVSQSVCDKNRFIIFPDDDYQLIDGELTMGGDSGSVWILNDGSMKAIGLHCLGNKSKQYDAELSVALNMQAVADHLQINF